jgi:hypothetical protein
MPIYREVVLENLALYQQILRAAERIKTLRREIDDVSRQVYQRLDDLDLIIEEIQSETFVEISVVDDEMRGVVCSQLELPPLSCTGPRCGQQAATTGGYDLGNFKDSCQPCVDGRNLSRG